MNDFLNGICKIKLFNLNIIIIYGLKICKEIYFLNNFSFLLLLFALT